MKTRWLISIALGIGCVLIVVLLTGRAISAAPQAVDTFNVNSPADAVDDNPGNGVCHTAVGACTLRAAVMEAVRLTTSVTINVPSGVYVLSIPPITPTDGITNGDLNLLPPPGPYLIALTINGAGMNSTIIDGNHTDRIFNVSPGRIAVISNLTIRNGSVPLFQNGGGIDNEGSLALVAVRVINNSAAGGLGGGGIYNNSRLTILDSSIDGNSTPNDYGGGIANDYGGSLRIYHSSIFNNRAPNGTGGGIYTTDEQVFMDTVASILGAARPEDDVLRLMSTPSLPVVPLGLIRSVQDGIDTPFGRPGSHAGGLREVMRRAHR